MKLIMENWKKFLKESSLHFSEKHFGTDPEKTECFEKLRKAYMTGGPPPDKRGWRQVIIDAREEFRKCMEKAGFKYLGEGRYRAVYSIPDQEDKILKIAMPSNKTELRDSKMMNMKEADPRFQTASPLVVPTYAAHKDYDWIVSKKVTPLNDYDFSSMQEFYPVWMEYVNAGFFEGTGKRDFPTLHRMLIKKTAPLASSRVKIEEEVTKALKKSEKWKQLFDVTGGDYWRGELSPKKITERLIGTGKSNSMFASVRHLMTQFAIPTWDVVPKNVGYYIKDNGKKQYTIIDPGFGFRDRSKATLLVRDNDS